MQRPVSSNRVVLAGFLGLLGLMAALAIDSATEMRQVLRRAPLSVRDPESATRFWINYAPTHTGPPRLCAIT